MKLVLKSAFFWFYTALMTLIVTLPILICSTILLPLNPTRKWAHRIGNFWGRSVFAVNPNWNFLIEGKEHLRGGAAVIVANHESMSDIIAMYLLRTNFKWLAKEELFRVPFFGWSMSLCGYIPLKRGSIRSARESFEKAKKYIKKGVSILIFPEGTRSLDGELATFKGGAFKLAIQEKVAIIPVVTTGTRHIIQKGSWKINEKNKMQIKILPPIATQDLIEADENNLRHETREKMAKALHELRLASN